MHAARDPTTPEDGVGTTERTRQTVAAYLDALLAGGRYGRYLAAEVTFTAMETDEVTRGREAVVGLIDHLHNQAFDATPLVKCLIVDAHRAAVEAEFLGTHVGEFAGIPPTGRRVRLPYAIAYDLADNQIAALRVYLPLDALVRQLRDA